MKKRGRKRSLDSIRAPSHKHHHHRAVVTAGFASILIIVAFGFLYALVDTGENRAGQANLVFGQQQCVQLEGLVHNVDGYIYESGRVRNIANENGRVWQRPGQRGSREDFWTQEGYVGSSFILDGDSSYVGFNDDPSWDFEDRAFTIEMWINTRDNSEHQYLLSHAKIREDILAANTYDGYKITLNSPDCGGAGKICFWNDVGAQNNWQGVDSGIRSNQWHHIAFVRSGTTGTFYVDGQQKGTVQVAQTIKNAAQSIRVGGRHSSQELRTNDLGVPQLVDLQEVHGFNGNIDEFAVFDRALSEGEINQIIQADSVGKCKSERGDMCYDGQDNDFDRRVDCEEESCQGAIETTIGPQDQFEVAISSQICEGSSYTVNYKTDADRVEENPNIRICDEQYGIERNRDRVAICAGRQGAVLDTLSTYIEAEWEEDVNIYYDGPNEQGNKVVYVLYTVDLSEDVRLDEGNFISNLLNGEKLAVKLGDDLYLLSHAQGHELYSPEHLTLTHLPSKDTFAARVVAGTLQVQFNVKGNRAITIRPVSERALIEIIPRQADESAQAFADPFNLEQSYEVKVTALTPARITNPANLGTYSICRNEGDGRDRAQASLCKNDALFETLENDRLTTAISQGTEFALLYQDVTGTETVSLLKLIDLPANDPPESRQLVYNDFVDNMAENRKIAFRFNEQLYLMHHEGQDAFSLTNIRVTHYDESGPSELPVSGNEGEVEITLLDGAKMWLTRQYGNPPGNFIVTAKTRFQLTPVNLDNDLFTTVSSLGPTRFILDELGIVEKHPDDNAAIESAFELSTGEEPHLILNFREPKTVANEALIYYDVLHVNDEGTPVKGAKIYRYYDLGANLQDRTRDFDNEFAQTFASGNQLALQIEDQSFYLLGHENPENEQALFRNRNLRLYNLDHSQTFEPIVEDAQTTHFDVPQGRITVVTDVVTDTMVFSKRSRRQLDQQNVDPFMATLTTNNTVGLKSGNTLQMCYVNALQDRRTIRICSPDNLNQALASIETTKLYQDGQDVYLLEANGEVQEGKELTVRVVRNLALNQDHLVPNYIEFTDWIREGQYPMFNISGHLYYPQAQNTLLETFSLTKYPIGPSYPMQNVQEKTPLSYNGSIVLHDRIVLADQEENNNEENPISLTLSLSPYYYVPEDNSALVVNSKLNRNLETQFQTDLEGQVYQISVPNGVHNNPTRFRLVDTEGNVFFDRLLAVGDSRNLLLDNVLVTITYESFNEEENEMTLTIQRQ